MPTNTYEKVLVGLRPTRILGMYLFFIFEDLLLLIDFEVFEFTWEDFSMAANKAEFQISCSCTSFQVLWAMSPSWSSQ